MIQWTDDKIAQLAKLKAEGKTHAEIAEAMGISYYAVGNAVLAHGLATRENERPKNKRAYGFDPNADHDWKMLGKLFLDADVPSEGRFQGLPQTFVPTEANS